jgi:hypothetical protein
MQSIALPETVYEIDREWFTRALEAGGHDAVVVEAERLDVIHATCTKARFRLAYDRDVGLPERMILKGAFEPHSERMQEMYQWEARFYAEIAPHAPLVMPRIFQAGVAPGGWRAATLMEDLTLRNVTFCRAQAPFGFDHVRSRLDQLARLHAQTWNSPDLLPGGRWDWVAERFGPETWGYNDYYLEPDRWAGCMASPRGVAVSGRLQDREWMRHALTRLTDLAAVDPFCLNHGDTHPGNLYVEADGTPGFLDVTAMRGPWWSEIAYHLVASIDVADRRAWEGPLLGHYLSRLAEAGGPLLDFETAWLRYRQGIAYGLFIFLINETTFQTEATNTAYTARFGFAAIDHDTVGLLA